MADDRKLDFDRYILAPTYEEQPPDDPDEDDEPQGGDVDTDHRCCTGSELTGHDPDCIHSTLASMNQHIEQLEQDLEFARAELKRIKDAINAARSYMPGLPDTQALVHFWKAISAIDTTERADG